MILTLLTLAVGLAGLLVGGELLVRGAVRLAERAGVTPLVIGLVIVGFGTSAPELVASLQAALSGSPAIAWGNIAGSNIANTLLILGAAALMAPIAIRRSIAGRDTGLALGASLALLGLAFAQWSGAWIGMVMAAGLIAYIAWCYIEEKRDKRAAVHNAVHDRAEALEMSDSALHVAEAGWTRPILLTVGGLVLLVIGGRLLVDAAIDLARLAGLGETVIGLTIVAIGTSMPELVTSLVAARKGETEVAFGNVVGSNIYNILGIGGVTMIVAPMPLPTELLPWDMGLMALSAAMLFAVAVFRGRVGRGLGGVLVASYCAYLAWLLAAA
ncbi:calcium/sodium antiporter [Croceicoccus marinus]|uniref:calcium/sodium antiporter n=1 Tax=Croceicoccus marinus TaxID=450378 RepID=UPI000AA473FA|nr:calcium/sodium antiporter [Croceicoccus marinus]